MPAPAAVRSRVSPPARPLGIGDGQRKRDGSSGRIAEASYGADRLFPLDSEITANGVGHAGIGLMWHETADIGCGQFRLMQHALRGVCHQRHGARENLPAIAHRHQGIFCNHTGRKGLAAAACRDLDEIVTAAIGNEIGR